MSAPQQAIPVPRAPAVQALLIQLLSFFLLLLILIAAARLGDWHFSVIVAGIIQGAIAAFISRVRKLAPWWWLIQFIFPVALVAMLSLELPPGIFLGAFLFLLVLYWSVFRTQVPFYPSGPATWRTVCDLLPQGRPIRFIDIGSGLGGLIIHLAAQRPDSYFLGIELAPLPWLVSRLRGRLSRSRGRFVRGDYCSIDFAEYDVVFAYLSPAAMPALWTKAKAEMRAGSLLLSYEFPIAGEKSNIIMMPVARGPALFGWQM